MDFKYGDLIIKCHQCGNEEVIEELVTEGRAVYLFNNDDSFLKLECTKCNITMEMKLVRTTSPEKPDDEDIIEEIKNEELQKETPKEEDL